MVQVSVPIYAKVAHLKSRYYNRRASERKKEALQAKENITGLVDKNRIQNGLFTAKEDDRRQNWMVLINTGPEQWQNN